MEPKPTLRKPPRRNQTSPGDKAKIRDVIDLLKQDSVSKDDGMKLCGAIVDRIAEHLVFVPCELEKDADLLKKLRTEGHPFKPLRHQKPRPAANSQIQGVIDMLRKGNASEGDVEKLRSAILDWLTVF